MQLTHEVRVAVDDQEVVPGSERLMGGRVAVDDQEVVPGSERLMGGL